MILPTELSMLEGEREIERERERERERASEAVELELRCVQAQAPRADIAICLAALQAWLALSRPLAEVPDAYDIPAPTCG